MSNVSPFVSLGTGLGKALFVILPTVLITLRQPRRAAQESDHIVDLVRSSCEFAAKKLQHIVKINQTELAKLHDSQLLAKPPQWDEFDWHCSREKYGDEITARYVFVLDALNYCFWPMSASSGLEYENLARGLRKACDAGDRFLDLDTCSEKRVRSWLEAPHEFPLLQQRVDAIRSLGAAFKRHGDALSWVAECKCSAVRLVDLIHERLEKFRDETVLDGRRVCFYKRAQILVADIWAAFGQQENGVGGFVDIDRLTIFADYRVPQLMRDMNILVYSDALASLVDNQIEIPVGSENEIAIRAASVYAVELLKTQTTSHQLTSVEVDWLLWQRGEAEKNKMRPNHRTLTTYY